MDGLDEFEKQLAAEKAERERTEQDRAEKKDRKHRHHHHHSHDHGDRRRRERSSERGSRREKDGVGNPRQTEGREPRDGEEGRNHRHRASRDRESDEDGHRHKRSRHSRRGHGDVENADGDGSDRRSGRHHRHSDREEQSRQEEDLDRRALHDPKFQKLSDPKEDLPIPDEEMAPGDRRKSLARDSWMTTPSALDIDYVHRSSKVDKGSAATRQSVPQRVISSREINREALEDLNNGKDLDDSQESEEVDYTFGDAGSQWRLTKLNAVYTTAEQTGRPVDEIGTERFGSLREFDDVREEKNEMDRRKVYGAGYVGKTKPTGDLYRERGPGPEEDRSAFLHEDESEQGKVVEDPGPPVPLDQTALNRLRAQMMKAKLRKAPDAAKLEAEYNNAMAAFSANARTDQAVVLDAMQNRMLAGPRGEVKAVENKRGRERGTVEANEYMSIDDMLREERRTRGQGGGEGVRLAERIAKDAKFDDDLEYLDENAEKLAKRVHKSETSLKNVAVHEFQKMNKILDTCPLCYHEDRQPPQDQPIAPVISLATRVFLTLSAAPELTGAEGGAVIVPLTHRTNLLECDDDEWEEIRNFMKSLTRLYHDQGREVLFYENAAAPQRRQHAALVAVPIPYDLGETAPAFFREAMLSSDEEWSQHRKVIDTARAARDGGLGKLAFRRSIAREMPYFHVWFGLDGGLGHVVEDADRWPRGDQFAREVIGGMVDAGPDVIRRQGRWSRTDDRIEPFRKRWRKFDWTRVLADG